MGTRVRSLLKVTEQASGKDLEVLSSGAKKGCCCCWRRNLHLSLSSFLCSLASQSLLPSMSPWCPWHRISFQPRLCTGALSASARSLYSLPAPTTMLCSLSYTSSVKTRSSSPLRKQTRPTTLHKTNSTATRGTL